MAETAPSVHGLCGYTYIEYGGSDFSAHFADNRIGWKKNVFLHSAFRMRSGYFESCCGGDVSSVFVHLLYSSNFVVDIFKMSEKN